MSDQAGKPILTTRHPGHRPGPRLQRPVRGDRARRTLNRNITDHHNENEQIAFGTGVLVDGIDFSDDKMPIGRTFSYSDTQRYRVGPNHFQLPINRPREDVLVGTDQGGGQMSYGVDNRGAYPHINFEPSVAEGSASRSTPDPQPDEQAPRRSVPAGRSRPLVSTAEHPGP